MQNALRPLEGGLMRFYLRMTEIRPSQEPPDHTDDYRVNRAAPGPKMDIKLSPSFDDNGCSN